ncbi:hypothetical protein J6590_044098 [Homalodisca vitripennis]|nr:hypothetical protein J6590_044098 [Homalodisca vitripennis]
MSTFVSGVRCSMVDTLDTRSYNSRRTLAVTVYDVGPGSVPMPVFARHKHGCADLCPDSAATQRSLGRLFVNSTRGAGVAVVGHCTSKSAEMGATISDRLQLSARVLVL